MRMPRWVTVDFETEGIQPRPKYPPKPVGVSILEQGRAPRYLAWGHPTGNNTTLKDAVRVLKSFWHTEPLLFHNSKFDLDVAETHMGLKLPTHRNIHDTMWMLFFFDPHAPSLSLKPSAERVLGIAPDERDELRDWIIANVPEAKRKPSEWGAYICRAPAPLVGKYAKGDVTRTLKLAKHVWPWMQKWKLADAYEREQRLLPILLRSEREGLRVDVKRLREDTARYEVQLEAMDRELKRALRVPTSFNLDGDELADALIRAKWVDPKKMLLTPKGQKLSLSKKSLQLGMKQNKSTHLLGHRNKLATLLSTFMRSWVHRTQDTELLYPNWHSVRSGYSEKVGNGARTGRIICTDPNLLNLAKSFEDRDDGYVFPGEPWEPLPLVRRYMLPDKGHVWCHRDYNQQELRILAHFEDGQLKEAYHRDPNMDVHNYVRDAIRAVAGIQLERRPVKTINFGLIYGMGLTSTADRLDISIDEAKELKAAQLKSVPGFKALQDSIKELAKAGEPIYTWGGRPYWPEEPRIIDDQVRDFIYKLLNYLIQGSAADCTKEALIRYDDTPNREGRFLVQVYDEVNVSSPKRAAKKEMALLQSCMQSVEFDVPMLSDGKIGPNWAEVE